MRLRKHTRGVSRFRTDEFQGGYGFRLAGIRTLALLGMVTILAAACSNKESKPVQIPPKPNVVFIVLDTLRADRIEAKRNGVPLMPYLAGWAKESVVFSNASSPCTWTRPSMASIVTSTYVDTHQVYFMGDPRKMSSLESDALPDSLETMASYMKKAGYVTAGIHSNSNVDESLGFGRGFDRYEYLINKPDNLITDRALEYAEMLPEPFFFYVHYMAPHAPYEPAKKYRELLGWPSDPAAACAALGVNPAELDLALNFMKYLIHWYDFKANPALQSPPRLSPATQEAVKTLYDAEIRFLDDQLARLLAFLRAKYPNTYFVIIADHGESFWEHDYLSHGLPLYKEEAQVPFMIWGPGIEPGVVSHNVEVLDVLPTLAGLLALEPNPAWQGTSLLAECKPASPEARKGQGHRPVYSRTKGPWSGLNTDREMVKRGPLKLIRNLRNGAVELYDLERDPGEKNNLAEQQPDTVKELESLLDAQRERNTRASPKDGGKKIQLDPETREQLKALGYTTPGG